VRVWHPAHIHPKGEIDMRVPQIPGQLKRAPQIPGQLKRLPQVSGQLKRLPQVSGQLKEAPAHALRAVFAGIGQLLLVTDRLRSRPPSRRTLSRPGEPGPAPERAGTGHPQPAPAAPPEEAKEAAAAAPAPQAASPPEPEAAAPPSGTAAAAPEEAAPAREATAPAPEEAAAAPAAPEPAPAAAPAGGPPIPNYDELSIASLRARLRGLSAGRVRELLEYEKAHAKRPEVMAMYERRAAKLESAED
jgi:hypothetical protein